MAHRVSVVAATRCLQYSNDLNLDLHKNVNQTTLHQFWEVLGKVQESVLWRTVESVVLAQLVGKGFYLELFSRIRQIQVLEKHR